MTSNLLASDIATHFYCGALIEPSFDLEEQRFGGSSIDLVSRLKRPVMIMPCMADSKSFNEYSKLLKVKLPTSCTYDYHTMERGFFLHGLTSIGRVNKAIHRMIDEITEFIEIHFSMELRDFIVTDEELEEGPAFHKDLKSAEEGYEVMKEHFKRTGAKLKTSGISGAGITEEDRASVGTSRGIGSHREEGRGRVITEEGNSNHEQEEMKQNMKENLCIEERENPHEVYHREERSKENEGGQAGREFFKEERHERRSGGP